jgi:predicted regulator of Ras-like GTPase activity (Roadblock/LC7/MglB family)
LSRRITIEKDHLDRANGILAKLQREFSADFLGLVSTGGHAISIFWSSDRIDLDAICSLAASSFAATRQLAKLMESDEVTLMFHEGTDLNVHISQVSDDMLLVVCSQKSAEIGKVRLISRKAVHALGEIFE